MERRRHCKKTIKVGERQELGVNKTRGRESKAEKMDSRLQMDKKRFWSCKKEEENNNDKIEDLTKNIESRKDIAGHQVHRGEFAQQRLAETALVGPDRFHSKYEDEFGKKTLLG